jgi:hypothetical protein
MHNFEQLEQISQKADLKKYELLSPLIIGHAIPFQL